MKWQLSDFLENVISEDADFSLETSGIHQLARSQSEITKIQMIEMQL